MVARNVTNVLSRGNAARARTLVALSLAAILTGCSSVEEFDVFGVFTEDPPAPATAGQTSVRSAADQQSAASSSQSTPALSSVPPRPEDVPAPAVRQRVVDGLVADRENARYSDEQIRLQGATRESAAAARASTTTAPPPPRIGSASSSNVGSPTRITPPQRPQTASVPPPAPTPIPLATGGPRPSVVVDPSAIDGGPGFPLQATRVTIDEQVATIHFAHSSSRLDERDKQVIAQVASAQRQTDADIVVVGHASGRTQQLNKVEHELANFRISMARANRVANQLVAMGVAREKVLVEAVADVNPRYAESMPTGEAGNRRTEIYFRQ